MKTITIMTACAAAVLSLGGCALNKLDIPGTVNALAAAGCKGTLDISGAAATATGVSVGSAHAENAFHGDCDPSRVQHPPAVGTVTTGAVISTSPNVSGPQ